MCAQTQEFTSLLSVCMQVPFEKLDDKKADYHHLSCVQLLKVKKNLMNVTHVAFTLIVVPFIFTKPPAVLLFIPEVTAVINEIPDREDLPHQRRREGGECQEEQI